MSSSAHALICGSIAYDTIMVFKDQFKNHILQDKVHMLNVSFLVPEMRKEFGGCAGNIAYNLKLLGGSPLPMATAGKDFGPYGEWMDQCGIDRKHVALLDKEFTAQAFITTDLDDNQITAFHPGAMSFAHLNSVTSTENIKLGIVAPDGRDAMVQHAAELAEAGTPFIFDPGQGLPLFDGEDLKRFIEQATYLAVNSYEWALVRERTGLDESQVVKSVEALIVTDGAQGSTIHTRDGQHEIPSARPSCVADPTGCGDAYRAGLLYGLMNEMDWATTGRIASLMGAIKVAHHGTQNHSFDRDTFDERFEESFGRTI